MTTEPVTASPGPPAARPGRPPRARWRIGIAAPLLGLVAVPLAACGSSPAGSAAPPVNACSLLTKGEVAAVYGGGNVSARGSTSARQSSCYYQGLPGGAVLLTAVTWDRQQLTTFQKEHGLPVGSSTGSTGSTAATSPATTVPATTVVVGGTTAFWVPPQPAAGPGTPPNMSQLSATKKGYVVGVDSTAPDQAQAAQVLDAMLGRL